MKRSRNRLECGNYPFQLGACYARLSAWVLPKPLGTLTLRSPLEIPHSPRRRANNRSHFFPFSRMPPTRRAATLSELPSKARHHHLPTTSTPYLLTSIHHSDLLSSPWSKRHVGAVPRRSSHLASPHPIPSHPVRRPFVPSPPALPPASYSDAMRRRGTGEERARRGRRGAGGNYCHEGDWDGWVCSTAHSLSCAQPPRAQKSGSARAGTSARPQSRTPRGLARPSPSSPRGGTVYPSRNFDPPSLPQPISPPPPPGRGRLSRPRLRQPARINSCRGLKIARAGGAGGGCGAVPRSHS